jgi:hypothetical protein
MLCLHCRRPCGAYVRRDLCRNCYFTREVRARYPCRGTSAGCGTAGRTDRDHHADPPPDPVRCLAPPGSAERLAVLAERRRQGYQLTRPDEPHDFRLSGGDYDPAAVAGELARMRRTHREG